MSRLSYRVIALALSVALCGVAKATTQDVPGALFDDPNVLGSVTVYAPNTADVIAPALQLINQARYIEALNKARSLVSDHRDNPAAHEVLGVALALNGWVEQAIEELKLAEAMDPKRSGPLTKQGDIYMATGRPAEGNAAYRAALAINPQDRQANQRLGMLAFDRGDARAALPMLEIGAKETPASYLGIKVPLATLYNERGDYQKTFDLLSPSEAFMRQRPDALALLGAAELGLHKTAPGAAHLKAALALKAEDATLGYAVATTMISNGQPQDGVDLVARMNGKGITSAGLLTAKSAGLFALGKRDDALKAIGEGVVIAASQNEQLALARLAREQNLAPSDLMPVIDAALARPAAAKSPAGLIAASGFYMLLNVREQAKASALIATQRFPSSADAFLAYGRVLSSYTDYANGIAAFQKAAKLEPKRAGVHTALLTAYLRTGRSTDAGSEASTIMSVKEATSGDLLLAGTGFEASGNLKQARAAYEAAVAKDPSNGAALNNLASVLTELNDAKGAVGIARQAMELLPDSMHVESTLGWALFKSGNADEAFEHLQRALTLEPADPAAMYRLAAATNSLGDKEQARTLLQQSLAAGKSFKEAAAAQKLLSSLK